MQRKHIEAFMQAYYHNYNSYRQQPQGLDVMDTYWSPDFQCTIWIHSPGGGYPQRFSSRKAWKAYIAILHEFLDEQLDARQHTIDVETMRVATQLTMRNMKPTTQQLICSVEASAVYSLQVAQDKNHLQIRQMELYIANERELRKPFRWPMTLGRFLWQLRGFKIAQTEK